MDYGGDRKVLDRSENIGGKVNFIGGVYGHGGEFINKIIFRSDNSTFINLYHFLNFSDVCDRFRNFISKVFVSAAFHSAPRLEAGEVSMTSATTVATDDGCG
jgi:hypothetical protein